MPTRLTVPLFLACSSIAQAEELPFTYQGIDGQSVTYARPISVTVDSQKFKGTIEGNEIREIPWILLTGTTQVLHGKVIVTGVRTIKGQKESRPFIGFFMDNNKGVAQEFVLLEMTPGVMDRIRTTSDSAWRKQLDLPEVPGVITYFYVPDSP